MMISLDGFFEGPEREIDWHNVDDEFNAYAIDFLDSVDTLMFGRVTYELMAGYWPTEDAIKNDPKAVAERMNNLSKIVFSNTLEKAEWNNTRLIRKNIVEEVSRLKLEPGKNIAIFGSSDLALSLIPSGLIDEFHILVNPVVLGKGKSLFKGTKTRFKLKLLRTRTFKSGNVLLCYAPMQSQM